MKDYMIRTNFYAATIPPTRSPIIPPPRSLQETLPVLKLVFGAGGVEQRAGEALEYFFLLIDSKGSE